MSTNNTNRELNDSGYVLVGLLLMLTFLTLIGIASTKTADLELQIGGNDKYYKEKQYLAEAAAMELIQYIRNDKINNNADALVDRSDAALNKGDSSNGSEDGVRNTDNWVVDDNVTDADLVSDDYDEDDPEVMARALGNLNGTIRHTSEDVISQGSSLKSMTQSSDHTYAVIGSYEDDHVTIVIEAGYRVRF